jgi:hypothetical protein
MTLARMSMRSTASVAVTALSLCLASAHAGAATIFDEKTDLDVILSQHRELLARHISAAARIEPDGGVKLGWKVDEAARKRWCAGIHKALTAAQLPPVPAFDVTSRRDGLAAIKKHWQEHYDGLARFDRDLLEAAVTVSLERQRPQDEAVGIVHRKTAFAFVSYDASNGVGAVYAWPKKKAGHSSGSLPVEELAFVRGTDGAADAQPERAVLDLNGELLFVEFGRYAADYQQRSGRWDGTAQGFIAVNAPNKTLFNSDWVLAHLDDATQVGQISGEGKPPDAEHLYACIFNLGVERAK